MQNESRKENIILISFGVLTLLPFCVTLLLAIGQAISIEETNPWIASLQLSQEQIERIESIEAQYSGQTNQLNQELQQIEASLSQLIIGTASAEQLRQKERDLEAFKIDAAQVYFEKFLAIRDVLTPAQLLKQCESFTQTREQRMERSRSEDR